MTRHSVGGPYPDNWKAIATAAKDMADWRCIRCGYPHDPATGHTLTVHHLNMNPSCCRWWNLAALCQKCHLQIQHKVILERPWMFEHTSWFKPLVAGYYAYTAGLPDDWLYVQENVEALLAVGQPVRV